MDAKDVVLVPAQTEDDMGAVQGLVSIAGNDAGVDPYSNPAGPATYWLIFVPTDDPDNMECAGYTSAHSFDYIARKCRGSIWIKPEHRRKGIAESALRQRNRLLFEQFNMNRIEWVVPADNAARLALAEKLGQKSEGTARQAAFYDGAYHDMVMFGVTRDEVYTAMEHTSDCAVHNAPAETPGPCDCKPAR